ncbi:hypothetical protein SASPL_105081 [Salvia splendens]|uniref:Uncharacterized protein n=1 Tax=Salvia splendens TaxID=180675 RepID=A0A8X9A902_SALSN|nr:hypothetical protein SASPL_105081 [Salvia splendens]
MHTEVQEQTEGRNNLSKRLLVKRKPQFLVDAMSKLNEAQINAVKELGFENVLHFSIDYIPSRLAEEDVELLYGFPRGDIIYYRDKWKTHASFMREIAEYSNMKPGNVNHKTVEELMLADGEGGFWFKRMFMVLLESALIETSTCGTIKSKIGHIIEDLDNVRNVNWCLYKMSILKLGVENWLKTEKNAFAGPLPFLLSYTSQTFSYSHFYINERLESEHLQAREDEETVAGIFGLGLIKKRYVRNLEQQQEEHILDIDDSGAAEKEEGEGTKEEMMCDDNNESASHFSTVILGSEQTTTPSLLSHEVNASKDANTVASPNQKDSVPNDMTGKTAPTTEAPAHINIEASQNVIGSENKGSESEIQKDLEHCT